MSHKFVHQLTETVKRQLEEVMLIAPSWEVLRVLYLARDLYLDEGKGCVVSFVFYLFHC